MYIDHKTK